MSMQPLLSLIRALILFSLLVTILCGRFGALEADGVPTRSWIWDQGVLLGYYDKHNEILQH
jgi:hypothetical protein